MTTKNEIEKSFYWEAMYQYGEEHPDCPVYGRNFTLEEQQDNLTDFTFEWFFKNDREFHRYHEEYQRLWNAMHYAQNAEKVAKESMKAIFSEVQQLEKSVEIADFFIKENLLKGK